MPACILHCKQLKQVVAYTYLAVFQLPVFPDHAVLLCKLYVSCLLEYLG